MLLHLTERRVTPADESRGEKIVVATGREIGLIGCAIQVVIFLLRDTLMLPIYMGLAAGSPGMSSGAPIFFGGSRKK